MNTPTTTKESEVDVQHAIEQANVALGVAGLPPDDIFRAELRQARAAVAEVFEAIKVYRKDYRQSGCPDPACIVCRRSKAAEDRLDTALRNAGVKV